MRRDKRKYDLSGRDKCEVSYGLKIPAKTKYLIEQLSPEDKKSLNEDLLDTIAYRLHLANYGPMLYLKS